MKKTISKNDFVQEFKNCGREENFSLAGLEALFDFIEELDGSCGTETELDVIALCCEFSEYGSALECIEETGYSFTPDGDDDAEEQEAEALEYLNDNTLVITFDGGIIIQDF